MGKLNAAKMRTLTKPGAHGDGAGLYLQVRGPHNRSWLYRFKLYGKGHLMGLGTDRDVSLAEARDAAAAARMMVRQGINPIDQRRTARAENAADVGLTLNEVADAYITAHEPSLAQCQAPAAMAQHARYLRRTNPRQATCGTGGCRRSDERA